MTHQTPHSFPMPSSPSTSSSTVQQSPVTDVLPEENLSLSAAHGYGYFPARPGLLLNKGRYEVVRKLGFGKFSSTWLVVDLNSSANARRYNAIKILTAYATQGHKNGQIIELKLLQKIKKIRHNDYLPSLSDHFEVNGPHGKHLCLVLGVLSSDISSFRRSAPGKRLPIQTVKRIITFILVCLNELHIAKIIHTDVKADNFLFDAGLGAEFDGGSKALPPIVVGEFELNGERYPIMKSQPIQHSFRSNDPPWEVDRYRVHLCDVGHGQWADKKPITKVISPFALRAPEVILQAGFDTKVDIWAIGCTVFELLTGKWLFRPTEDETYSIEEDHLARMLEATGESFPETMLVKSPKRTEFLDANGNLLRIGVVFPNSLERMLTTYNVLRPGDIAPTAAFLRACLRLDPSKRPSAGELLGHRWLVGAGYQQVDSRSGIL